MKRNKIILDDDFDELQYIKVMNHRMMFRTDLLNITIAPTLNCNFNCSYCYENKNTNRMSFEVQNNLIDFNTEKIKTNKNLDIWWYGGEPLLEKKTIWRVSKNLTSLCKKHSCDFTSRLVTNGYLLDKKTLEKLKEYNFSWIQITVDGPKEIHDKRRGLKSGGKTFDTIINNLISTVEYIPEVVIRVNVDKNNASKIINLLNLFSDIGLKNKIQIYYAPIIADTVVCNSISEKCFAGKEFSNLEVKLLKLSLKKGYEIVRYPGFSWGCVGLGLSHFVIDPDGDIYKCWRIIGIKEEKIGNLNTPVEINSNYLKWLSWDPLSIDKCKDCEILPICVGGCPYHAINLKEQLCKGWKYNLKEMLKLHYLSYLRGNEKKK